MNVGRRKMNISWELQKQSLAADRERVRTFLKVPRHVSRNLCLEILEHARFIPQLNPNLA